MSTANKPLRQPGLIVYFSGLGTSALVLWLVHYLNESHQFNIMGWYVNGILPAGAIFVGILSGLGYAIASRLLQVKLSKAFVIGMITTAILDYIAAQYLTYAHIIEKLHIQADQYTFLDYVRDMCEKMSFKDQHNDKPGDPLGVFGYFFKLLEMAGYALGAMVPSMHVFGMCYCKKCQKYLLAHRTGYVHSPSLWANVKKMSKQARLAELQSVANNTAGRAQQIAVPLANASLADTEKAIAALDSFARKDATARVAFILKKCPTCDAHHLELMLNTYSVDKRAAATSLVKLDKTEMPDEQVSPA
jgi:hypothetical protein